MLASWLLCGFLLLSTCHGGARVGDLPGGEEDEDRRELPTSAPIIVQDVQASLHPFRLALLYPELSFVQGNLSSAKQELLLKNEIMPWITETLSRYIKVFPLLLR